MGHRIEPYVSIPTKLQTDSTGFTLESVIHIGCDSPNAVVIKSASFSWFVKFKFFCKKMKCEKARCDEVLVKSGEIGLVQVLEVYCLEM